MHIPPTSNTLVRSVLCCVLPQRLLKVVLPHLPCAETDIERPGFRFIYLVVSSIMKRTGFMKSILQPFERLFSRSQCLAFLHQMVVKLRRQEDFRAKTLYDGNDAHHSRHFLCVFSLAAIRHAVSA